MRPTELGQKLALAWILIVLAFTAIRALTTVAALGNSLSPTGDAWTEADILRAGEGYARLGFSSNSGLPDMSFGEQFADQGTKAALRDELSRHEPWRKGALSHRAADRGASAERFVYTHYPPGPHWLAGGATRLWGVGRVNLFRAVPLTLGLLALLYLSWVMIGTLGHWPAALLLTAFSAPPMLINALHSLAYQGYALALLLFELGLSLRLATTRPARSVLLLLLLLGFCQGWLGFDYLFLIALCPLAVQLVARETFVGWQAPVRAGLAAALGYALAHLLHLLQVVWFFGSAATAFADFASVAQYRSLGGTSDSGDRLPSVPRLLWKYLTTYTASPTEFGVSVALLVAAALALFAALHVWRTGSLRGSRARLAGLALAVLASSSWVIVMPQHSAQHWHILPRHYFLTVFTAALVVLSELTTALPALRPAPLELQGRKRSP